MSLPLPTRINGQVIDQTWFNLINDELVLLNDRFNAFVSGTSIQWIVDGAYGQSGIKTQYFAPYVVKQDRTAISLLLKFLTAPTVSGNLEIDIEFKRGAGAWTSILNVKPKIPFSAGDYADSDTGAGATAAVINTVYEDLQVGDLIRMNVTEVPDGSADSFLVVLDFTVTGV